MELNEPNITVFEICKEQGLNLRGKEIAELGTLVREAWNMVSPTPPTKVKLEEEKFDMVNSYPSDFKPVVLNCINTILKKQEEKRNFRKKKYKKN